MVLLVLFLLLMVVAVLSWRLRQLQQKLESSEARCEALRQSEARFHAIADCTHAAEAWLNPEGRLVWINRAVERLSGYPPFECLVQQNLIDVLIVPEHRAQLQEAFDNALLERSDGTADVRMRRKDGSEKWIAVSWQTIHGKDGIYLGLRVSATDIENRKDTEQRLIREATRDALTGLYNRRRFDEDLPRMLADAERHSSSVGLLSFDLDGFKPINDRFGHAAGDIVLKKLADAVGATIRRSETFYRMGGDEFSILVGDTNVEDMRGLAQRISAQINALSFEFDGQSIFVTASTGIALYPDNADAGMSLMAAADMAMYADKAQRDARVNGSMH